MKWTNDSSCTFTCDGLFFDENLKCRQNLNNGDLRSVRGCSRLDRTRNEDLWVEQNISR
jgi:hypothetical protein